MSLSLFHRLPKQVLSVHRITKKRTGLGLDVEKEMATHSNVLAWRIPGTEEPSGLPSMGSHRVGHDWSDLAAAAAGLDETLDHLWSLRGSSQQYFSTSLYCIECTLQIRDTNSSFCNVVSISISLWHPQEKGFSVQLLSHIWLFAVPRTTACQASLSITNSWSLLKLMSIESVMPSNHLILCCPLFLLPSIFPSIGVFSSESVLHIRWPKYWSFSMSISPSNHAFLDKFTNSFNKCGWSSGHCARHYKTPK